MKIVSLCSSFLLRSPYSCCILHSLDSTSGDYLFVYIIVPFYWIHVSTLHTSCQAKPLLKNVTYG